MPDVAAGVARARTFALALLCVLLGLSVLAVVRGTDGLVGAALLGAFLIVPALLPLRGMVRGERRVHAWATLCLAPHVVYALTELVANPTMRGVAVAMLCTVVALTLALVACLRLTRPR